MSNIFFSVVVTSYNSEKFIKKTLESLISQNFKNFEVNLYPKIIRKHKCKFEKFSGFWHSIDNIKDVKILKSDKDKRKKIINLLKKLK